MTACVQSFQSVVNSSVRETACQITQMVMLPRRTRPPNPATWRNRELSRLFNQWAPAQAAASTRTSTQRTAVWTSAEIKSGRIFVSKVRASWLGVGKIPEAVVLVHSSSVLNAAQLLLKLLRGLKFVLEIQRHLLTTTAIEGNPARQGDLSQEDE